MLPRVFVANLKQDYSIVFDKSDKIYNYLVSVLRLGISDSVIFFSSDLELCYSVVEVSKKDIQLCFSISVEKTLNKDLLPISIIIPFIKPDKMILVAKQAIEIGVRKVILCKMHHSSVNDVNIERITANMIEALEQCGGNMLPELLIFQNLHNCLISLESTTIFYGDCKNYPPSSTLSVCNPSDVAVLCGPEGGFSAAELEDISTRQNTLPIRIGNRTLRVETACVSLLAIIANRL